ncbi:MAG: cytochrome o ubiquinol oxidase subunit III [Deltaproteobacteria bacterium]|nr:cytochrome o ubiquinol oxidase subunit III [Deltaproteobacteria bacterium]
MTTDLSIPATDYSETNEHADILDARAYGFWIYLMSDLVLFSAIFATHAVLARSYAGGPTGKDLFDLSYTFGETLVLLFSSTTCGLAMLAVHAGKRGRVLGWLLVTFLLGAGFIAMEISEFSGMIQNGYGPDTSAFLSAFFTLVGTHGAHVTFGLVWMAVMCGQIAAKGLTRPVRSRLMRFSMFWHFLDIVWIGIFTFVYLMGVM